MGIQTATTGNLDDAQRIVIAQCRYTLEHNAVMRNLVELFKLGQGEKQITVPKVSQMTAHSLTDGVDLAESEDIGMTTTDLTTSEVGLKVILTYKLLRQENEDVFRIVGRQMGDALARKVDEDLIALLLALNGGLNINATAYTSDALDLDLVTATGAVAWAKTNKCPAPISLVAHPYSVAITAKAAASVGATTTLQALDYPVDLLTHFFKMNINGMSIFEDGNIATATHDSQTCGVGGVFSKSALAFVESQAPMTEREKDISLRGWEVMLTSDYGAFELDDNYGAPLALEATVATTAST